MSTIAFDTLKFVEKLEKAKAEAEVLDSGVSALVTKKDMLIALGDLRADIMKWVIGLASV